MTLAPTETPATLPPATLMQFGVGRFLLAHVDLFASQARSAGGDVEIIAVQTSDRPAGRGKARALAQATSYPVQLRGRRHGELIDTRLAVDSITRSLVATEDWAEVHRTFCNDVTHVVSNTSESGYLVATGDSPLAPCPVSFPAKLTQLLKARFDADRPGVALLPCELLTDNAGVLRDVVLGLARDSYQDAAFEQWLTAECVWVPTLVDRIVSAELEPVGAVAEPYGLWAIQQVDGLTLPFRHDDVLLVEDLGPYERRKLHLLNLAHTWLVARARQLGVMEQLPLVRQAMEDPRLGGELIAMLREEVVPVLDHEYPGMALDEYVDSIIERFCNPWLDHQLVDIAQNHEQKLERRLAPVLAIARRQGRALPRLAAALAPHTRDTRATPPSAQ
ncbi:mannitol dehydrogenase [Halomonas denitrificans]|uniref:mannitol dehydrogenase family protein n=1 Tax=Halomonas TaxID=2745 RepID=UPI001CD5EC67|nr:MULTISPECIES: mannitol dehydrogenase [Halomonas]MCA0973462.1 mannitol dehydrogenase [Halomonas denitrificans]